MAISVLSPTAIAFFTAQIDDVSTLLDGLLPGIEAVIVPSDQDGIQYITHVLQERENLTEIYVIAHGTPGCLYLGNTELSLTTLKRYESDLRRWCNPQHPLASLALYGCNVGAGDAGTEFIHHLHRLIGTSIAASTTPIGNAARGGNWLLDVTLEYFAPTLPFQQEAIATYSGILAPGDLDPNFGNDGTVYTLIGGASNAERVIVQPDGKILAIGWAGVGSNVPDFVVVRYNPDGSLDRSYGNEGIANADLGGLVNGQLLPDSAYSGTLLADGSLLLAGRAFRSLFSYDMAAIRLRPDGSLDTSFGTNGRIALDFSQTGSGGTRFEEARSVLVDPSDPDGRIWLIGYTTLDGSQPSTSFGNIIVARYTQNGQLDTSFGANGTGIVQTDVAGGRDEAYDATFLPDGRLLVTGRAHNPETGNYDLVLVAYNRNGSLDTSFGGGDGIVFTDFGTSTSFRDDTGYRVVVNGDRILVVGSSAPVNLNSPALALAQFDLNGNLDTSFGTNGRVFNPSASTSGTARDVVVQPDGKFLIALERFNGDPTIVRFNANGTLDPTFGGGDGIAIAPDAGGNNLYSSSGIALTQVNGVPKAIIVGGAAGGFSAAQFELTDTPPPPEPGLPDFVVTNLTTNPSPVVLQGLSNPVSITWTVANQGTGTARTLWTQLYDGVYLSNDEFLDSSDTVLLDPNSFSTQSAINRTPLAPGQEDPRRLTFNLPTGINSGNQYLIVTTDGRNAQPESNEANNVRAFPITINAPDLVVSDIIAPPQATAGQQVELAWTFTNQGTAASPGFFNYQILLSSDDQLGNDIVISTENFLTPINPGQSIELRRFVTLPTNLGLSGNYRVVVRADTRTVPEGDVREGSQNEGNNARIDDTIINIRAAQYPNLQVTSVTPPAEAFSGRETEVTWTVRNNGETATSSPIWYDRVYLSSDTKLDLDGTDIYLGEIRNTSALGVGQSYTNSLKVNLPDGLEGPFYFLVQTDGRNNAVDEGLPAAEADNFNNGIRSTINLPPLPDLQVTRVNAPANAFSGELTPITWTVQNRGTERTLRSFWSDRIYLSEDANFDPEEGDILLQTVDYPGILNPGESYTQTAYVRLPAGIQGDRYFFVVTDDDKRIFEGPFENNNTNFDVEPTNVVLTPPPDLEVRSVAVSNQAIAGLPFQIAYDLVNAGSSPTPAAGWIDTIYLSPTATFDPTNAIKLGDVTRFGGQAADNTPFSQTVNFTLDNNLTGNYYVFVQTDAQNRVLETSDANNFGRSVGQVEIVSRPADLVVSQVSAVPLEAEAGKSLQVNWTVQNQGTGVTPSSNWLDRVYLSTDGNPDGVNDILLTTVNRTGSLTAGGTYSRSATITLPFTLEGNYELFVVTDAGNSVFESNQTNNVSDPLPLNVGRETADLRVTGVTALTTAVSGTPFTVNWTVQNFGSASTNSTSWSDGVYLSTDTTISENDIFLGQVFRSGSLGKDEFYDVSRSFTLPIDLSGNYHVLVRSDRNNTVIEGAAENNNDRATTGQTTITRSNVPDLQLVSVTNPATAITGQNLSLTWTVRNNGVATTGTWFDSFYLSRDQIFDRRQDIFLGSVEHTSGLAATNGTYTKTQSFTLPQGVTGNFYVYAVTDSTDRIYERGNEVNNTSRSNAVTSITVPPPADLSITSVQPEQTSGAAGDLVRINYTVQNNSANPFSGDWENALYLSADQQWDVDDILLGYTTNSSIGANGQVPGNLIARLPGVKPGEYYVLGRADIRNQITESNEANNITASVGQINVTIPTLELGVPTTGQLQQGASRYYKVEVTAGETLLINLDSEASSVVASNELYVRFGDVPTRSDFDVAFDQPFSADQQIQIPVTQSGTYYILAYSNSNPTVTNNFTITAETLDFSILNTSFGQGGNAGNLTLEIKGAKFDRTVTARIIDAAGVERQATAMYYENQGLIYATFDLKGLAAGDYDVVIQKATGETASVTNGLEVVNGGGGSLETDILSPNAVGAGRNFQFSVSWANSGLNDLPAPVFVTRGDFLFNEAADGVNPPTQPVNQTGVVFVGSTSGTGPVGIIRPGQTASYNFVTGSLPADDIYTIEADPFGNFNRPFNWESIKSRLIPSGFSAADFEPVFQQLIRQVGTTWGDVQTMLARNASLLPTEMGNARNLDELMGLEVQKAIAAVTTSIRGSAFAPSFGVDLSGRTITARNLVTDEVFVSTTLNDGSFFFNQITPGNYTFAVEGSLLTNNSTVTVNAGQAVQGVSLNLTEGTRLSGVVRALENGSQLAGATIALFDANGELQTTTTDATGRFDIGGLRPGTYALLVNATDRARAFVATLTIPASGVVQTIELARESVLTGTVNLQTGGIDGTLQVFAQRSGSTNAGDFYTGVITGNRFEIDSLPAGAYDIVLVRNGYLTQTIGNVAIATGQTLDLGATTLLRSGTISGSIQFDTEGLDVSGAVVGLFNGETLLSSASLNTSGSFTFDQVQAGTYTLRLLTTRGILTSDVQVTVAQGETVTGVALPVSEGGVITGTVTDSTTSTPLENVSVSIVDAIGNVLTAITNSEGVYRIGGLTAGNYQVRLPIAGPSSVQSVTIPTNTISPITANLQIPVGTQLTGRLLEADRTPVADAVVYLLDGDRPIATASSDAQGNYRFWLIQGGQFNLRAVADGSSFEPINGLTIATGAKVTQNFSSGSGVLNLTLSNPGRSIAGATVLLFYTIAGERVLAGSAIADATGLVTLDDLAAGTYSIQVLGGENYGTTLTTTIGTGATVSLSAALSLQSSLSGQITDAQGSPLTNAIVSLVPTGGSISQQAFASSTANGSYELSYVEPGTYDLVVFANGYQSTIQSGLVVNGTTQTNVSLAASATNLAGRLVDTNGQAIAGGTVTVLNAQGVAIGSVTSQADGSFSITSAAGSGLSLDITLPNSFKQSVGNINLNAGSSVNLGNLALNPVAIGEQNGLLQSFAPTGLPLSASGTGALQATLRAAFAPNWLNVLVESLSGEYYERYPFRTIPLDEIPTVPAECYDDCQAAVTRFVRASNKTLETHRNIGIQEDILESIALNGVALAFSEIAVVAGTLATFLLAAEAIAAAATGIAVVGGASIGFKVAYSIAQLVGALKGYYDSTVKILSASSIEQGLLYTDEASKLYANYASILGSTIELLKKMDTTPLFGALGGVSNILGIIVGWGDVAQAASLDKTRFVLSELQASIENYENAVASYYGSLAVERQALNALVACIENCQDDEDDAPDEDLRPNDPPGADPNRPNDPNTPNNPNDPNDPTDPNDPLGPRNPNSPRKPVVRDVRVIRSRDPNDIVGPEGFGEQKWVTSDRPLGYTIRFENDPQLATAPAQLVLIEQQLDPDLDFRSFRLGSFGFGDFVFNVPNNVANYQTRLDLRETYGIYVDVFVGINVQTGRIFWELRSIDPETGEIPFDPTKGFLPPNLIPPQGDGFVTYTVRAKEGVSTGTVINAEARIIFDTNEPIDTPPIFNTLDAGKPTSAVTALPATSDSASFLVSWTGSDPAGGSALASYTIFVSENGGAFQPWLTNTTLTEATYTGQPGKTYAFYSVARDNAGNVEAAPATPDAQITIAQSNRPPIAETNRSLTIAEDAAPTPLNISAPTDPDGDALTITITEIPDAAIASIHLANGTPVTVNQTLTIAELTNLVVTLVENANGTAGTFSYTVSDEKGGVDTATINLTVDPVNDAPTAVADAFTTTTNSPLTILTTDLLSNDSDVDGDGLSIVAVSNAVNGSASLDEDGNVQFIPDVGFRGEARFDYTVSDGNGGEAIATAFVTVTAPINPGTLAFSGSEFSVNENGTVTAAVTIHRTDGSDGPVSVTVNLADDTATSPADYNNTPITVDFAEGEVTKTVTIPIANDAIAEGNETINLTLTNPTGGAAIGSQNTATLTIVDDDVTLAFANATFRVNEDGTAIAAVTVTRTGRSTGVVGARVTLQNGTASAPSDYTNTPIDIRFADGETSKTINIPIINDIVGEKNETIRLTLGSPTGGARIGTQSTATLTVIDDDVQIVFASTPFGVREDGTPVTAVTVRRIGVTTGAVSATVVASDGTATAPDDYNNEPIEVHFNPGETTKTVVIPVEDDTLEEGNETIQLELRDPTGGATIGGQRLATLIVLDNDGPSDGQTSIGDDKSNKLTGTDGNDSLYGGNGNDTLSGDAGNDSLYGGNGNDTLNGGTDNDLLDGGAGNDYLAGGPGDDILQGGTGNDTYVVGSLNDQVIEGENAGIDTVRSFLSWTLNANVENLILLGTDAIDGTGNMLNNTITGNDASNTLSGSEGNDAVRGNAGNDTLYGGSGNDNLDGGSGEDLMIGGFGNDTYTVSNPNDQTIETSNAGIDTVRSSITWTLSNHLENLVLTGTNAISGTGNTLNNDIRGNDASNLLSGGDGRDSLKGNAGNDTLYGENGNDNLDGGLSEDLMIGGLGNDTYTVSNLNDQTIEDAGTGTGTDTVRSSITWMLGNNLENLILLGTNAINGTGNTLNNTITGNDASNTLSGGTGNDTLNGGAGEDTLIGGFGNDRLTGGSNRDQFVYTSMAEAGDSITDFNVNQDILVLSSLFDSLGYAGSDPVADGYMRLVQAQANTQVQIDLDGAGSTSTFRTLVTLNNVLATNLTTNNIAL